MNYPLFLNFPEKSRGMEKKKKIRERHFRSPKNCSQVNLCTVGGEREKERIAILVLSYGIVLQL